MSTLMTGDQIYDLDRAHVFHSWSAQRYLTPIVFIDGPGCYLWANLHPLQVVPPCTISEIEAKEGLAILDDVLSLTDRHAIDG